MKNDTEDTPFTEENPTADSAAGSEAVDEAAGADADSRASSTGDLLGQIEQLQQEAAEHKDRYLRSVADMENLRKRVAREKEDIRRRATAALIEDLLPALDNMQMGLSSVDTHPEAKEIAKGFEMVVAQMNQILSSHGLEAIEPAVGTGFDHNLHESVAMQPSADVEEQHILSVMRIGYKLNDHLLRPASVVVSSGKE